MTMPGFLAEASVYRSTGPYGTGPLNTGAATTRVAPMGTPEEDEARDRCDMANARCERACSWYIDYDTQHECLNACLVPC